MKRPKKATIIIKWVDDDEYAQEFEQEFTEVNLEDAYDLIGLMIGELSEGDLQP